ncbi:MAG: 16S rRNA processing protein RimM [Clostridia bacterium]|nr:16S rRNA processing protein RimM [Clostridia bacterium]
MKQTFLEAGKIRNTHALRGEVKMECWLEGEKPLSGVKSLFLGRNRDKELKLLSARIHGDVYLVLFEGIDSVEKATPLKGKTLWVAREELDPDGTKVYYADLIGLPMIEEKNGTVYGTVVEVSSRGASELFTVRLPDGKERYFPAVPAFVVRLDAEKGVFVRAPEGIFD